MATQLHGSEKRLHPRISVDIKRTIIFHNRPYKGIIQNVSRHGLYIRIISELTDQLNLGVEALEPPSAFMSFVLQKESTIV